MRVHISSSRVPVRLSTLHPADTLK
jgi:hypothetical protein